MSEAGWRSGSNDTGGFSAVSVDDPAKEPDPEADRVPYFDSDDYSEDEPEEEPARVKKPAKKPWWVRHYTFTGSIVALIFIWLSMTPSLLPRGPLFQGLVSAGSGAVGYALGTFAAWLVRFMLSKNDFKPAPLRAWLMVLAAAIIGTTIMVIGWGIWQNDVRDLMNVPRLDWSAYPISWVISIVVLFLFVEIGQLIGKLVRWLVRLLNRFAPPRISAVVAVLLVVVLMIALLNGVVVRVAMDAMNSTFKQVNNEESPDTSAPTVPQRSGGPDSLVAWSDLGHQGRVFVSNGPSVEQLSEFNGAPATEPIRAYAGLGSADGIKATAAMAARELDRAGGLDRAVVAVATTTGTGWINEAEASALEYMYNGDTAIVSMQYSFLPSWLSFLVDKENARQSGQALFEAVDALIRERPEGSRPKLVVFGESLGSFGGEAPFLSLNNMIARTDGALFSGPTFNNTVWTDLRANRDPGSPEWLPIYDGGANARFVAIPEDLNRPDGSPWETPRVVYLQHASDPISWWDPDLLFTKPDWLREARGYDVLPTMEWIPVVTFFQVSADMAVAVNVPAGHGHVFVPDVANAWAAILEPPGWTDEKTAKLRPLLHSDE